MDTPAHSNAGAGDDPVALREQLAAALAERDAAVARELALAEALAQRNSAFGERIEHQAATVDVLKAMSASPGDARPVFDLIIRRARELCNGNAIALYSFDGHHIDVLAWNGPHMTPEKAAAFEQQFPSIPRRSTAFGLAILERREVHIRDTDTTTDGNKFAEILGIRSVVSLPLMRDGIVIGAIALNLRESGGFSDSQIALLRTFAEQAVIAMNGAETYQALQSRTADLQESLEYQTATSDVLKVISRATFDLQPVLETLVTTAARLCGSDMAFVLRREGEEFRAAASVGFTDTYRAFLDAHPIRAGRGSVTGRVALEHRAIQIPDVVADPEYTLTESTTLSGQRTALGVPLLRQGELIGVIVLARRRVEPFTERQIDLVQTFADQAVIAIENTRLVTEQQEALKRQTATTEVLQVINASPGDLAPVFETVLDRMIALCDSAFGILMTFDGQIMSLVAAQGLTPAQIALFSARPPGEGQPTGRIAAGEEMVHLLDARDQDGYRAGFGPTRAFVDGVGARTVLFFGLRNDSRLLGIVAIFRREVRAFSDKEIALVRSFAAQAVIAMENAHLLNELRSRTDELAQRQAELRVTFENMGDGVALFDSAPRLLAWNSKFQEIFTVPEELLRQHLLYADYIRFLADRGDFGADYDIDEQLKRFTETVAEPHVFERLRPDGRMIEIRHNPVAGGGFVLIFSDITERRRNEEAIRAARDAAETAVRELKLAQANLIQAEKMASLGQLTAGIAHEIKNPLNFVNNFAILSVDLLTELQEVAAPAIAALPDDQRADIDDLSATLTSNLRKITEHGKRADNIVKSMLEHSRGASGERRTIELNALVEEALNLAYHGARAQDQSFNVTLERDFGDSIPPIELNPQDVTRVLLNLFSNGFYAVAQRARTDPGVAPHLRVSTRDLGDQIEIQVHDNGSGIPATIRDRLFEPFFTTKPTGEGTGLGLSITYDIVTKQHGGTITVDSEPGAWTAFTIRLPRLR